LGKEAQRSHHEEHEEDFLEHIAIFLMFLIRVWRASPFLFTDLSVLSQTIKHFFIRATRRLSHDIWAKLRLLVGIA